MSTIAVLGAGAWGTALAAVLARGGHRVTLCARRADQVAAMRARRENEFYLPGVALPETIDLSDRWAEAAGASEVVLMAVPSRFARAAMTPVGDVLVADATLISVIKGVEEDSLKTMTAMLAEVAPAVKRLAVLSGPSFAAEVARGKPAAIVAGARDETIYGLAGLGDLVLTCTGDLSRNRALGLRIGHGESVAGIAASTPSDHTGHPVAEGVSNARSIRR